MGIPWVALILYYIGILIGSFITWRLIVLIIRRLKYGVWFLK